MTIYGEILFVENFISGIVILLITAKVRGYRPAKLRQVTGAVMCGAYAFILTVPMEWWMSLITKLVFSIIVVLVVFGKGTILALTKTVGAFYIISFLAGGVTIALMYLVKMPGMTANGSLYMNGFTYFQVVAGLAATWFLGIMLAEMLTEKICKRAVIKEALIHLGEKTWNVTALIDTGNSLREPLTGYPVAVLSKARGNEISKEVGEELTGRLCLIPYRTVGGKGLLYGFRPDAISVGDMKISKVIIGISEGGFDPWEGTEKYEILLHQQLFKGED